MKQKMLEMGARWFLGGVFREIAEGKRGPGLQALYVKARGRKTVTGFVLATVVGGVAFFNPDVGTQIAPYLGPVAGLLIYLGLLDKQWRKPDTPTPAEIGDAFHAVMSAGPVIAAVMVIVLEILQRLPNCTRCGEWSLGLEAAIAGVGATTGWLSARFAEPPDIEPEPPPVAPDDLG